MSGYTCAYGSFLDTAGSELDDGIATVFRAPHSYTGEDTVEFSCHGGILSPASCWKQSTLPVLSRLKPENSPSGHSLPAK